MEDVANGYKISVGKPSAKSPTRIIRLREYDIEMDLTETGGEYTDWINPLNAELNPICHLLALLGVHHYLHISRIRVNLVADRVQWLTLANKVMQIPVP